MVQQLESSRETDKSGTEKGAGSDIGRKVLDEQHASGESKVRVSSGAEKGKDAASASLPALEITGSESGAVKSKVDINNGDTLSHIAARALGPHAERRDIYNYVNQLAKHNHITDKDKIYAGDSLELVEYKDPRKAARTDDSAGVRKTDATVQPDADKQGAGTDGRNSGNAGKDNGKDTGIVDGSGNGAGQDIDKKVDGNGDNKGQTPAPGPDGKRQPDGADVNKNLVPNPVDGTNKGDGQVPVPDSQTKPNPSPNPNTDTTADADKKPDPAQDNASSDSAKGQLVDNSGSNFDKTMHVAGLAMEGAKDHVAEHPLLVAGEVVVGTAAGVVLATTAPVWLTAGVAVAGIGYLGKTIYDKSGEVMDSLHTIYADKVNKDDLDKAEKTVKHDLGVGVVDGAGILVGGVGTKLIVGKFVGKAGAAAAGEESAEAADELAKEGAKQAAKQGGSEASNEAADETAKETAKEAAKQGTNGGQGGDKTATNTQTDKSIADKSVADKNGQQPTDGSDAQKHRDAPVPVKPEGPQGGSSEWTGNKYENADGSFRQEDSHWVSDDAKIAVVSDGMGGHGGGDAASRIATDVMESRAALLPENAGQAEKEAWLRDSIKAAAERIKQAEEEPTYTAADGTVFNTNKGMGATIVASIKHEGKMLMAWAGDSRVYRVRDGQLEQLTEDHSWAVHAKKNLGMSDADIDAHPDRSVINSALGNHRLQIGEAVTDIKPGDRFILASDGLESLDGKTVANVVQNSENTSDAAKNLVQAVRDRHAAVGGTQDNVTAVVLEPEPPVVVSETAAPVEQSTGKFMKHLNNGSNMSILGSVAGTEAGVEQAGEIADQYKLSFPAVDSSIEEYTPVSDFPGDQATGN